MQQVIDLLTSRRRNWTGINNRNSKSVRFERFHRSHSGLGTIYRMGKRLHVRVSLDVLCHHRENPAKSGIIFEEDAVKKHAELGSSVVHY